MNNLVIENAAIQHKYEQPMNVIKYNPVTGKTDKGEFVPGDNVQVSVVFSAIDTLETLYADCMINMLWADLEDGKSVKVYQFKNGILNLLPVEAVYDETNDKLVLEVSEQLTVEFTDAASAATLPLDTATIL